MTVVLDRIAPRTILERDHCGQITCKLGLEAQTKFLQSNPVLYIVGHLRGYVPILLWL